MNEIVQTAFRSTAEFLRSETELMPSSRWNESVFRYYFCRFLAKTYPQVEQSMDGSGPRRRFSQYYDDYRHPRDCVSLRRMECTGPVQTPEAIIRAQLYEVA